MPTDQSLNGIKRIGDKIHVSAENQLLTHSEVQRTPAPGIGQFVDGDVQRGRV